MTTCEICGDKFTSKPNHNPGSLLFIPSGEEGMVPQGVKQELPEICSICSRVVSNKLVILLEEVRRVKRWGVNKSHFAKRSDDERSES